MSATPSWCSNYSYSDSLGDSGSDDDDSWNRGTGASGEDRSEMESSTESEHPSDDALESEERARVQKRRRRRRRRRRQRRRLLREAEGMEGEEDRDERALRFLRRQQSLADVAFQAINTQTHSLAKMDLQRHVPNFYHYVYTKDNDLQSCPGIVVPDTVLFVHGKPLEWYFTSKRGDRVLKKRQDRLTCEYIKRAFLQPTSYRRGSTLAVLTKVRRNVGGDESFLSMRYLEKEGLCRFLDSSHKSSYVVLQRFVDPQTSHNTVIRVDYDGPLHTKMEQRQNVHEADDETVDLQQRMSTFEGRNPEAVVAPWAMRSSQDDIRSRLYAITFGIVLHVRQYSIRQYNIEKMRLNFKIGPRGRLWFLWASHIHAAHKSSKRERQLENQVMRRLLPIARAHADTPTETPPALSKAIRRFKDMRSSVLAGKTRASDPAFVNSLLRAEIERVSDKLRQEKHAIKRLMVNLVDLEDQVDHEQQCIESLKRRARTLPPLAHNASTILWSDSFSLPP